ncbi:MAG: translation initiation factor IF-3 [Caldisericia bacterium]|nr:translation initiation factor IF-3 [Caldisericia bacterium]MDD4614188.1 translation initiation factor IF-3 [Caldisericia bacterium]
MNGSIGARQVRLIDEDGGQVGIVDTISALNMARNRGYDLVEIAPDAKPPVCKIMDYGKFVYDLAKKNREAKKKQVHNDLKICKIGLNIAEGDFDVRMKRVSKFLQNGDKVKLIVMFRGREIIYKKQGFQMIERITEIVDEFGKLEGPPKMEGKNIIAILAPVSKKG